MRIRGEKFATTLMSVSLMRGGPRGVSVKWTSTVRRGWLERGAGHSSPGSPVSQSRDILHGPGRAQTGALARKTRTGSPGLRQPGCVK